MKVEGPKGASGSKGVTKTGSAKSTGSTAFSGMVDDTAEAAGSKSASGVMSINQLDALLSAQEGSDATSEEARKRAKRRGLALLDQLDVIRMGMLTGGVPQAALQQLTQMIGTHRDRVMDPQLAAVLDEIDLRAQVELAKLEM